MSETTTTPSFRDLLSQHTDAAERPRPLAAGHYYAEITRVEYGRSAKKQTPFVRFFFKPSEESSDVEDGANGSTDITSRELRKEFYITPKSLYKLADFLDAVLGKSVGISFDRRIPDTRGARVLIKVDQRPAEEGDEIYNDVGTVVATH